MVLIRTSTIYCSTATFVHDHIMCRHCGVWDSEQKRNCTRSLTCKSHSVYLKRKVINRTGPFDELLAQHKAEKEATVVRSSSIPEMSSSDASSSILATRLKLPTGPLLKQEVVGGRVGGIQVLQPTVKPVIKDSGCDESLHYTTGWMICIRV